MATTTPCHTSEPQGTAAERLLPADLEQEVRKIYKRSPLYGQRFPLHPEPLHWSCFREIPVLSKQEIIKRGHQAVFAYFGGVGRRLPTKRLGYGRNGGPTPSAMTGIMGDGLWNAQTARAYLASPILGQFV